MPKHVPGNKRQVHLIEKGFQISFILKFCILVLAAVIVSSTLILFFTRGTLTSTFENSRLSIQSTAAVILPALLYTNLITLGLVTIATVAVTLFVSHRIAGPLYRLQKELSTIGNGDLTLHVSLRKRDQVAELAQSLNNAVMQLRDKILEVKTDLDELDRIAREANVSQELVQAIDRTRANLQSRFII